MIDKPTVVIVDDHPWIRSVVAELLQPMFRVVALAEDGDAALRVIGECCPQLVILDINMPKVNGFEVARQLIRTASPTKVVFEMTCAIVWRQPGSK
jgi:two-component system response regulator DegU